MRAIGILILACNFIIAQDSLHIYKSGSVLTDDIIAVIDNGNFHKNTTPTNTVTDVDGNVYHTVTIGTQIWMVENLRTTRYRNGDLIPCVTDGKAWFNLKTPGYCWYNNDAQTYNMYGALYNWYAVDDNRKIAPAGWHIPTNAEWTILTTYLGGEIVAGGKLKETGTTHWQSPNTGATNETGFTALPGGYRYYGGIFIGMGGYGYWWSASQLNINEADNKFIISGNSVMDRDYGNKSLGGYVRCLKD